LNATERANRQGPYPYYGANGLVGHIDDFRFDGEYVLLAEDGGYFGDPGRGVAYEASGQFWVNNHAHILAPLGEMPIRFLRHSLNALDWMPYVGGTTRLKLTQAGMRQAKIMVPPLPEQHRIVAKIDSLSSKSRRAREQLDRIPRLVKKYKQAVLAAAYEEARGRTNNLATLGQIALEIRNGLSKKPSDQPPGLPILRISAVRALRVRLDDIRYYPVTEDVPESALLKDGDLLFTRYNGNPEFTAACGLVNGLTRKTTYPDKLIRVRLYETVEPRFVELLSASPQSRQWLAPSIKSAAGQHGISGADLKRMPIPLPALPEQRVIAARVGSALAWIDRLAAETISARELIDRLDQAVLARAFQGELVPQDPSEEPASVLLDRIRAQRAISQSKSK
jgi:type I restriction enzyme S subunit